MGGYTGEKAEFDRIHKSLTEVKGELDGNVNSLEGEMQDVLSTWKGGGADAFRALMEQVDEKGRNLNTALQGIADLLEQAGAKYEGMEAEGADSFSAGGFPALG